MISILKRYIYYRHPFCLSFPHKAEQLQQRNRKILLLLFSRETDVARRSRIVYYVVFLCLCLLLDGLLFTLGDEMRRDEANCVFGLISMSLYISASVDLLSICCLCVDLL